VIDHVILGAGRDRSELGRTCLVVDVAVETDSSRFAEGEVEGLRCLRSTRGRFEKYANRRDVLLSWVVTSPTAPYTCS
jgi:hypothetical protein